jgi:beta-aspartyl-dipeptidase (metallo-type)
MGVHDVLVAGDRVVAMDRRLDTGGLDVTQLDLEGRRLLPGLIDGHLHIVGGGGNEGYGTRIPELWTGELLAAGITTVVAPPGLDMVTKSLEGLLAKAYALHEDGITALLMTGGFQRPFPTLTGSVARDLFLVDRIVGVKIALGEHRATRFRDHELSELAGQLEWLSGATGKACVLHSHLGEAGDPAAQLLRLMGEGRLAPQRFQATHLNHSPDAMAAAPEISDRGGTVDVNPILDPAFGHPHATPAAVAVRQFLDAGLDPTRITMTSDGNASVPIRRPDGSRGNYEKSLSWLWGAVVDLVRDGVELEQALAFVTSNPARVLRLPTKGSVRVGGDADLLVVGDDLRIEHVFARGRHVVADESAVVTSMYEPGRQGDSGGQAQRPADLLAAS